MLLIFVVIVGLITSTKDTQIYLQVYFVKFQIYFQAIVKQIFPYF